MKKYFVPVSIALLAGIILGKVFLEQYDAFSGIRVVSNNGESLYFIKYDVYDTLEELEKSTLSLTSYIYSEIDNKYHAYIGITSDPKNLIKLNNYYSGLGYKTITEEFMISNSSFLKELENLDNILKNTDDEVVLTTVSNLILEKYEEMVINGS